MIRVRHNDAETRTDPGEHGDLRALVRAALDAAGPGRVLTRLAVNACEIPEPDPERLAGFSLERVEEVDIESRTAAEVARASLESAAEYSERVEAALVRAADLFRAGHLDRAGELCADGADALGVLLYVCSGASIALGAAGDRLRGLGEGLTPWLESVVKAQEQYDWLRVADCLEYELAPRVAEVREAMREALRSPNPGAAREA